MCLERRPHRPGQLRAVDAGDEIIDRQGRRRHGVGDPGGELGRTALHDALPADRPDADVARRVEDELDRRPLRRQAADRTGEGKVDEDAEVHGRSGR
jgi:hypothetical protein